MRRIQTIVEQLLTAATLGEHGGQMDEIVDLVATSRALVADYAPLVIENKRHIEFDSAVPQCGCEVIAGRWNASSLT